jgi:fatty acid desaturase
LKLLIPKIRIMRTHKKAYFIAKGILFGAVAGTAFTFALLLLWNWLMPLIFGLGILTFWQALGLFALSKILFGSGGHHSGSSYYKYNREKYWKEKFKEKIDFAKMHHGDFRRPDPE